MEITNNKTVAEIVAENVGSDAIFSKYNIDFCCGGSKTLEAACNESNVDIEKIKFEILSVKTTITSENKVNKTTLSLLIEEVKNNHQTYCNKEIKTLLPISQKVTDVHGYLHKELIEINTLFKSIDIVLDELIINTNNTLYPLILKIEKRTLTNNEEVINFKRAVSRVEIAHRLIGDSFKEISKLSNNYTAPVEACNSYKFFYLKLSEIENQLHKYFHFEEHKLISKANKFLNK